MRLISSLAISALLLFGSLPARATVIRAINLEQMVGRAQAIFVGKVLHTVSRWTADGKRIVTDATLLVEQGVRGARTGERVVVRRLGGTVDGIGMRVSGSVVLTRGDSVLLFTEQRRGHRFVVGMRQGLYHMASDGQGQRIVTRQLRGLDLVARTANGRDPRSADLATAGAVRLDEMIRRVRQAMTTCERQPERCRQP